MPMLFDIFFSICQTPVNGVQPNEKQMFANFFEQVRMADEIAGHASGLHIGRFKGQKRESAKGY